MASKSAEFWVVIVSALLAVVPPCMADVEAIGRGNTWIALRYRFKPGERVEYAYTQTESTATVLSVGGESQDIPTNTTTKINFTYDVLDVDTQGTATVKLSVDQITIEGQRRGRSGRIRVDVTGAKSYVDGRLVFDSSSAPGVDQSAISHMLGLGEMPQGIELGILFIKGITVQIPRLGYMDVPEAGLRGSQTHLGLLELFEPTPFPAKLVRPGDTWSTNIKSPTLNAETIEEYGLKVHSTLEAIEQFQGKRCAKVISRMDMNLSKIPKAPTVMTEVKVFNSRGETISYFDIEEGRLLKGEGEFFKEIQGVQPIDLEAPEGIAVATGASGEVTSSSKMAISIELKR